MPVPTLHAIGGAERLLNQLLSCMSGLRNGMPNDLMMQTEKYFDSCIAGLLCEIADLDGDMCRALGPLFGIPSDCSGTAADLNANSRI